MNNPIISNTPRFLCLSLRYVFDADLSRDEEERVIEETHIIPVYDCYSTTAPLDKLGDEYRHYYIRNYVSRDVSGENFFFNMIDKQLKVCFRDNELFFSDSKNKTFRRLEGKIKIFGISNSETPKLIGTLEEMTITL